MALITSPFMPSPTGKVVNARTKVDMAEREELMALRMRELQQEVKTRRRDLSQCAEWPTSPSGAPSAIRDAQTARGARTEPLLGVPLPGAMSARSAVTRDDFGHLSWKDRDPFETWNCGDVLEKQIDEMRRIATESLNGHRRPDVVLRHEAEAPESFSKPSAPFREPSLPRRHPQPVTGGPNLESILSDSRSPRTMSPRFLRKPPQPVAFSGGPDTESIINGSRSPRSLSPRFYDVVGAPEQFVSCGEQHQPEQQVSMGDFEDASPLRRMDEQIELDHNEQDSPHFFQTGPSRESVIESPRDADEPQELDAPEQDPIELDAVSQWMTGLRRSEEEDGTLEDPSMFGAGFKPPKRTSESCGPWVASFSFSMGASSEGMFAKKPPAPNNRRSAPAAKVPSKPDVKAEAKAETRTEGKPDPRPEPKPEPKVPQRAEAKSFSSSTQQRERKSLGSQSRPQATPQTSTSQVPPQGAAQSQRRPQAAAQATAPPPSPQAVPKPQGASAQAPPQAPRASSCSRASGQNGAQARPQSPRAGPQTSHGNATSPPPPRNYNVRSPRHEHSHRSQDAAPGAFGGAPSPGGRASGQASSPPMPRWSPPPGSPPAGSASTGRGRQAPRAKAEAGSARPPAATAGKKAGSQPSKLLDALKAEMMKLRRVRSPDDRKKDFLKLCFQWHPDKNPANVQVATRGFQMLQEQKSRLLAG